MRLSSGFILSFIPGFIIPEWFAALSEAPRCFAEFGYPDRG